MLRAVRRILGKVSNQSPIPPDPGPGDEGCVIASLTKHGELLRIIYETDWVTASLVKQFQLVVNLEHKNSLVFANLIQSGPYSVNFGIEAKNNNTFASLENNDQLLEALEHKNNIVQATLVKD